jgi:hypothetical protein
MPRLPVGPWLALGGLALLGAASAPAGAQEPGAREPGMQAAMQPEIGEEEMRAIVHESLGVEILRVEVVEHDGQPAYAVTVMNPPGNRNDAFRVATLLFDGATGSLLGQESPAPRAIAPDLSTAQTPSGFEAGGPEIRRRTYR